MAKAFRNPPAAASRPSPDPRRGSRTRVPGGSPTTTIVLRITTAHSAAYAAVYAYGGPPVVLAAVPALNKRQVLAYTGAEADIKSWAINKPSGIPPAVK